jgi:hypothetical protein
LLPGFGTPFPAELGLFLTISIFVAIALSLAAGRRVEDPEHVGPFARYLAAIILLTFFVALFAAFSAAFALTDIVVNHEKRAQDTRTTVRDSFDAFDTFGDGLDLPVGDANYDFSSERSNDANYSAAVASGLIAITSGAIWLGHRRWRRRLDPDAPVVASVERVARLGVCFVTAITVAIAITNVGFGIFEIAAPGIAIGGTHSVGRAEGISEVLSFGLLAIAALIAFWCSWKRVRPHWTRPAPEPEPGLEPAAAPLPEPAP